MKGWKGKKGEIGDRELCAIAVEERKEKKKSMDNSFFAEKSR